MVLPAQVLSSQPDKQLPPVSVANRGGWFKPAWVLVMQNVLLGLGG